MRIQNANDIRKQFFDHFGEEPEVIVRAPGRINLLGEHTDYNEGFVLPAAIDRAIYLAFSRQDGMQAEVVAVDMQEELISLPWENPNAPEQGHWAIYPYGVMQSIRSLYPTLIPGGFRLAYGGNIPGGAGLSSSAAVESGIIFGLNYLFDWPLNRLEMALLAQFAEQKFVGLQCGLMDMYASLHGKKDAVLQLDCRTQSHTYFPLDLGDYELILFNSNVKHALVDSAYNQRREACETGVGVLQKAGYDINSLRDVSIELLDEVRNDLSSEVWKRCTYVIQENNRVQQICQALEGNDLKGVGQLMKETHDGLSLAYEVSCPELDFLVNAAMDHPGVLGARMMGGGFGGCTLNLVHREQVDALAKSLQSQYESAFPLPLSWYHVTPQEGCEIIWKKDLEVISY